MVRWGCVLPSISIQMLILSIKFPYIFLHDPKRGGGIFRNTILKENECLLGEKKLEGGGGGKINLNFFV